MKGFPGNLSLKGVLAIYFLPITIFPTIFISIYATRIFEDNTREGLVTRIRSEHEAIVSEISGLEAHLFAECKAHASSTRLIRSLKERNGLDEYFETLRSGLQVRVYAASGKPIARRRSEEKNEVAYISADAKNRLFAKGETLDRYFAQTGIEIVLRALIRSGGTVVGILEEKHELGARELSDLKSRWQVDLMILKRDLTPAAASFALSKAALKEFSRIAIDPNFVGKTEPTYVKLGGTRFVTFLFDLPGPDGKEKKWGYIALFAPLSSLEMTSERLNTAML